MDAMKQRTNIRLDEQARQDAQQIAQEFNLGSTSAAVRFALREVAKRFDRENRNVAANVASAKEEGPQSPS